MWKQIIFFLTVIVMCSCQSDITNHVYLHKKKPFYYDSYLLYGGGILYYLTFILIKVKVAFVLGTIFTVFLVAGKLYAIVKYADHLTKSKHEPEKIYMPSPSHTYDEHGPIHYSEMGQESAPFFKYSPGPSVSVGDQPPPNAEISGGQYYDSPPSQQYGRNAKYNELLYYDLFFAMINKFNGTEIAFETMKLKTAVCKQKFVCRIEYTAKYSTVLYNILSVVRDQGYNKYKLNGTTDSWTDCDRLFPNCKKVQI